MKHTDRILFLLLIFWISKGNVHAQDDSIFDYSEKKTYEIGGITIQGAETRDRNAIKSITGLREGGKVQIPGTDIPTAIKSLLKLRLFDDVQIILDKVENNIVFLRVVLVERPILTRWSYKGVKTSQHEDLNDIVKNILTKGGIVTDDQKNLAKEKIKEYYVGKGKLDAKVDVLEVPEESKVQSVRLVFEIYPNERVKVENIVFEGNDTYSSRKLRKKMSKIKRKGTLLRKSKFIQKEYQEDLTSLTKFYQNEGYKNMTIVHDTVYRNTKGNVMIEIKIDEGKRHYFRDIKWKGNTLYKDDYLYTVLGISKGDVYNPELLQNRLKFSMDGRDISSLYLDDGYLAFEINPVEIAVEHDSVDIEMRIFEGPQFTIDNIVIKGNDRTNENVVRREIRTRPGQKFSRSDIIRSQREIINLGYFNPETLGIETPVNQGRGTVGVEYNLEEKPSDQLELSAGYGGFSGLIGTLGVVFNNFSIANIKDRSTWSPLPQGDGQKLSLRLQSNSRFFKSYNFSFTEPWLGGKKPRSFTIGAFHTAFDYTLSGSGKLGITRGFVGLGSQLKWPDDYFSSSTTLNIEQINLDKFIYGGFPVSVGKFNNFSVTQTITRSSVSDPLYPRSGSRMSLSLQVTPPYSLFRKDNTFEPSEAQREDIIRDLKYEKGPANPVTEADIDTKINELKEANRFKWLEYHKWKIASEWYFNLIDKLVVASTVKMGILGSYNSDIGISPFERFQLGGDGINNQNVGLQGREIISMRGYDVSDITGNGTVNSLGNSPGAPLYNKFTVELRYPLSLNPNSTIFVTSWIQGGNAYESFKKYNPFDLKRSAGFGARVFLPMFGLLGFDYGWGFDKTLSGTQTYGKFNIVLGFEPE
ncbi:MAG TPA: POTRA domain-containing protein [Saprospiraceae bacterium]|nr:outer membrane protein assembly factor BamA [Saprospiraceae bacterium]HRO09371.1 POTRA domain-containing protein [Saprospiraceae bacterium]HRP42654.1 POTRA domain-containing protein [Saprospiraceae bacterium]